MSEYMAMGEDYILTTEQNIAERNNMLLMLDRKHYLVVPKVGDRYDFRDAKEPVWVCGKPYNTMNGRSGPINVQGKKIEIVDVCKGNMTEFARITFKERKIVDMTLSENQRVARHYCAGILQGVSDSIWGEVSESYVEYVVDLLMKDDEYYND